MKSIKNYLLAVLALATILTVASCKNEDEETSKVASYTLESDAVIMTLTAYDNDTFSIVGILNGNSTTIEGIYEGDVNENGDITLELTKVTVGSEVMPEVTLASFAAAIGGSGTSKKVKGNISNNGRKLTLGLYIYTRVYEKVASYIDINNGGSVTFYDDGTFYSGVWGVVFIGGGLEGTYKGNVNKNGEITLELSNSKETVKGTVSDNGKTLEINGYIYTRE